MTVGVGIPLTKQFNSVDSLALAIFGFIGTTNIGASPDSSFSNKWKIQIINKIYYTFLKINLRIIKFARHCAWPYLFTAFTV